MSIQIVFKKRELISKTNVWEGKKGGCKSKETWTEKHKFKKANVLED